MKNKEPKILCPYCSKKLPIEIETEVLETYAGCDTCGYGQGAKIELNINCPFCKKLIYTKEVEATE